jgi:hypothetical protein
MYSLPRFFEYKTELRKEILTESDNATYNFYHLVIKNKLHNSAIYQYAVHLSKILVRNLFYRNNMNVLL